MPSAATNRKYTISACGIKIKTVIKSQSSPLFLVHSYSCLLPRGSNMAAIAPSCSCSRKEKRKKETIAIFSVKKAGSLPASQNRPCRLSLSRTRSQGRLGIK
jgi:hypothetical protein